MLVCLILLLLFVLLKADSSCQQGKNNCILCNPISKLCLECEYDVYTPDKNGGCEEAKICILGKNFCNECDEDGKLCTACEDGYFPDKNGGCSYSNNCEVSFKGKCLKCKQNEFKDGFLKSYCLNNKYGCVEAIDGCLSCDDMYNFNKCTKCYIGFYFDDYYEFCYECKNGCTSCTNYENCGGCGEGFYTINEASSPESYDAICEKCIKGCKQCSNDIDCEICYDGYYLTNENPDGFMQCESCSTFCVECYDKDYCLKCLDGYELVGEGDKIICQYHQNN